jgi:hypothetical protein
MASKCILQYTHVPFWNIDTNKAVKDMCVIKTKLLLHFEYENKSFVNRKKDYNEFMRYSTIASMNYLNNSYDFLYLLNNYWVYSSCIQNIENQS